MRAFVVYIACGATDQRNGHIKQLNEGDKARGYKSDLGSRNFHQAISSGFETSSTPYRLY